jgi:hypothetical protein
MIGAGIESGRLFASPISAVEETGLVPHRRHHTGQAIGFAGYENPFATPGNKAAAGFQGTYQFEMAFTYGGGEE